MMIPKVINEGINNFDDGTYCKQYVVHAPEWDIHLDDDCAGFSGENYHAPKVDYFIISEATRMGYTETLVFPANSDGSPREMVEIMGSRGITADEILTSFALHMMEAGYDTV